LEFASGKHLANYLLKIFKNNNIDVPKEDIKNIRELETIFTFIANLPSSIKRNIEFSDVHYPWIALAQGNRCRKLSEISKSGNECIAKFINNPSISFGTVLSHLSYGLNI